MLTLSQCRPLEPADSAPCERCIKEGVFCEYRPVDTSSASNNHPSNYINQDTPPITLYDPSAPPPNPDFTLPVSHSYGATEGGYVLNNQTFNPAVPFQPNLPYPTPPYQSQAPSYPVPHYPYNAFSSEYSAEPNYQSSPQFGHPPNQYMTYPPAHGHGTRPYYHR